MRVVTLIAMLVGGCGSPSQRVAAEPTPLAEREEPEPETPAPDSEPAVEQTPTTTSSEVTCSSDGVHRMQLHPDFAITNDRVIRGTSSSGRDIFARDGTGRGRHLGRLGYRLPPGTHRVRVCFTGGPCTESQDPRCERVHALVVQVPEPHRGPVGLPDG